MRTVREAIGEILERVTPLHDTEHVPLRSAAGRVLAEAPVSDVELPPFEKSAMDGFAVRSADFAGRGPHDEVELAYLGESRAGAAFDGAVPAGSCVAIYTGAELPADCDAVVMVEKSRRAGARVALRGPAPPGQHVNHRGEVLALEQPVGAPGRVLTGVDLAVLAAVGADPAPVFRRPRISILTTGDELVRASERPGRGQIREGNTLYLAAAAEALPVELVRVGIVGDDPDELERAFAAALDEGDALVTTGGVSMGRYDLVGPALEKLGAVCHVHKVAVKPGKPIWFGLRGDKPIFGLPGNPVSSLLGFELFVRPALLRLAGAGARYQEERLRRGRWAGEETAPNDVRQQNLPARVVPAADGVDELVPVAYRGSADVVGLCAAEAFALVEPGAVLRRGDALLYRPLGLAGTTTLGFGRLDA